jgi:hypothetical protein
MRGRGGGMNGFICFTSFPRLPGEAGARTERTKQSYTSHQVDESNPTEEWLFIEESCVLVYIMYHHRNLNVIKLYDLTGGCFDIEEDSCLCLVRVTLCYSDISVATAS